MSVKSAAGRKRLCPTGAVQGSRCMLQSLHFSPAPCSEAHPLLPLTSREDLPLEGGALGMDPLTSARQQGTNVRLAPQLLLRDDSPLGTQLCLHELPRATCLLQRLPRTLSPTAQLRGGGFTFQEEACLLSMQSCHREPATLPQLCKWLPQTFLSGPGHPGPLDYPSLLLRGQSQGTWKTPCPPRAALRGGREDAPGGRNRPRSCVRLRSVRFCYHLLAGIYAQ